MVKAKEGQAANGETAGAKINYEKKSILTLKENPYIISTIVLGLITIILLFLVLKPGMTGNVISSNDAGSILVDYLNARVGGGVVYVSSEDFGNVYQVLVSYNNQQIPVYISKDGKYFIQSMAPITGEAIQQTEQLATENIPKSDKPKAELFVMTHCPYGTQAEKGFIPAIEALGNKADAKIRFVHYFMHGDKEEKETYNQVCIREEQQEKYLSYLKCFLEVGDTEGCLVKAGIDKTKLNSCLQNKAKEYYAKDSELSNQYGVQGSPTLVINGVEASSARDSASFLKTICSAFNVEAEECSKTLSASNPTPGFGYTADTAGHASTDTTCR